MSIKESIIIAPNKPMYLALVDPEGDSENFDFALNVGRYQTTTGGILTLPKSAVVKLNALEPKPGEEIQITKIWSGKTAELPEWTICLSTRSEQARAKEEMETQNRLGELRVPIEQPRVPKTTVEPPTPIRAPGKPTAPADQPRLFDRGTGTHGPAPLPAAANDARLSIAIPAAPPTRSRPALIPANIAVKEILAFIAADPNTRNWSDQAVQNLASTVIIAAYKAGQVGLWERGE